MITPEKKELPSIEDRLGEVMETICDYCHYPYVEPTEEETLTGCCSKCESCSIEGKVKELVALARGHELVNSARMVAKACTELAAELTEARRSPYYGKADH